MTEMFPPPVCDALIRAIGAKMKKTGTPVPGVRVSTDDTGRTRIINKPPRMSVSQKIRQSKSKKVHVSKRTKGAQRP